MTKKLKYLFVAAILAANVFLFVNKASAKEGGGGSPVPGLKGSINGIFACHCPDDALTCYCAS
jgi:hypothetical protein